MEFALPVYTAAPAQAQYVAAAPPSYVAAAALPVQSRAMPMAQPVMTAQPVYAAQAQQAASLFDALDTNHDGTITRAEFARLAQQLR
jgi:hypothetical protein